MTALYIVLGIIAFIIILLICNIRVKIKYDECFFLRIYFLCFFFTIYPQKKKKTVSQEKEEPAEPQEELKDMVKDKGIMGTFSVFADFIKQIMETFKKLLAHMTIKPFKFKFKIGGNDAATVAVEYGTFCSAFYPLLSQLYNMITFKKSNVDISADYTSKKYLFNIDMIICIRLIFVIIYGISFIKNIINFMKSLKKDKNERNDKA